jgi:hypothetical protein
MRACVRDLFYFAGRTFECDNPFVAENSVEILERSVTLELGVAVCHEMCHVLGDLISYGGAYRRSQSLQLSLHHKKQKKNQNQTNP